MVHIPTVVNDVARLLGHAMSVTPEEAAACPTVAAWHDAATRALAQRHRETQIMLRAGLSPVSPAACWLLDNGSVRYTTRTGRLAVHAGDDGITFTIYAGPGNEQGPAFTMTREPDGRYRLTTYEAEVGPHLTFEWVPSQHGPRLGVHGAWRPGRLVVLAGLDPDDTLMIEWIAPGLAREKPERLALLAMIDDRVLGGAIARKDSRFRELVAMMKGVQHDQASDS